MPESALSITELRAALNRLVDAIEDGFGEDVPITDDYYWNVWLGDATLLDTTSALDMGSLADDVHSIRAFLAEDPDVPPLIWHEADHLAGVLRAIARHDLGSA